MSLRLQKEDAFIRDFTTQFLCIDGDTLQAVRLMDGGRDLPRRLTEPPGA
jgi:hypothetical protein